MCLLQKGEVGRRYLNAVIYLPPLYPQTHKCYFKHSVLSVKLNIFHFPVILFPYLYFRILLSVFQFSHMIVLTRFGSHGNANFYGQTDSKFLRDFWRKLLGKQPVRVYRIPWSPEEIFQNTIFLSSDPPSPNSCNLSSEQFHLWCHPQDLGFNWKSTYFCLVHRTGKK